MELHKLPIVHTVKYRGYRVLVMQENPRKFYASYRRPDERSHVLPHPFQTIAMAVYAAKRDVRLDSIAR